tara:strand:- start:278 stop:577 length:300 start_codon:yes stop_codon:yes gene_type:complete
MILSNKIRKQIKKNKTLTFDDKGQMNELSLCYGVHNFDLFPEFAKCKRDTEYLCNRLSLVQNGKVLLVCKTWKSIEEKISNLHIVYNFNTGKHRDFYKS